MTTDTVHRIPSETSKESSNRSGHGPYMDVELQGEGNQRQRVSADEAPAYTVRSYIFKWYRVQLSPREALATAFHLDHNEAGNIHTHLWGIVLYGVIAGFHFAEAAKGGPGRHAVGAIYFLGVVMMLVASVSYHTLVPVSQQLHDRLYVADLVGVSMNILGISLFGTYTAFSCKTALRIAYMVIIIVLSTALVIIAVLERLRRYRALIISVFSSAVVGTSIPIFHLAVLAWGDSNDIPSNASLLAMLLLTMLGIYGVGVVIFGLRFPEAWWPGSFDLLGHSHQLWHLFVLAAPIPAYVGVISVGDESTCPD